MTKKELDELVSRGHLPLNLMFWTDYALGSIALCWFPLSVFLFVSAKNGEVVESWIFPIIFIPFSILIIKSIYDQQLTVVKTDKSAAENLDILETCLTELDWKHKRYAHELAIISNRYILKFVSFTIIYKEGVILYNFRCFGGGRFGRPPMFLGVRSYLKWKFRKKLNEVVTRKAI